MSLYVLIHSISTASDCQHYDPNMGEHSLDTGKVLHVCVFVLEYLQVQKDSPQSKASNESCEGERRHNEQLED